MQHILLMKAISCIIAKATIRGQPSKVDLHHFKKKQGGFSMKFNSHIKYKTKPKLLHLLLSLIITLSMIIPMFTAQTLEAYATSAGGDMGT